MSNDRRWILEQVARGELDPARAAALWQSPASPRSSAAADRVRTRWYAPEWQAATLDARPQASSRPMLVCGSPSAPWSVLAQSLAPEHHRVAVLGADFQSFSEERFIALARSLGRHAAGPLPVVYFASPDDDVASVRPVFELSRVLLRAAGDRGVRLAYLYATRGVVRPMHAAVSGLARTIRLENPRFEYQVIRIDGLPDERKQLEIALDEVQAAGVLDAVVLHNGAGRFVRCMQPVSEMALEGARLRPGGVYWITGGAGGLGRLLAEHLARSYGAKLMLTGRSSAAGAQDILSRCAEAGGEAIYIAADVSRAEEASRAAEAATKRFGRIDGVVHAAGIVDDEWLIKKSNEAIERVLAPKVSGVICVDDATRDQPLDFFVMFSSLVSVVGNPGQSDYAVANAFLDEFAQLREARRLTGERFGRTLSINWPHWAEGGMAVPETWTHLSADQAPLLPLPTGEGLVAFETAVGSSAVQAAVAYGESVLVDRWLSRATGAVATVGRPPIAGPLTNHGDSTDADVHFDRTAKYLAALLSRIIKLPVERIRLDEDLEVYGIDSIIILNANADLEKDFGPLSKTLFFEHRNLRSLTRYFTANHAPRLRELFGSVPGASTPAQAAPRGEHIAAAPRQRLASARPRSSAAGPEAVPPEEPSIAIIGVAGRYPMASDLDAFWENLRAGRDCIVEIPPSRWDHSQYFDPRPDRKGKSYSRWGGFIDGVDEFDPLFFNILPREARIMDPQERLFLETAWSAIENAGYTPEHLLGPDDTRRQVSVFVGVMYGSYQLFAAEEALKGNHVVASSAYYTIANRVSYTFDLHGPSMAVDTACSSSLVALHLACESIRRGECRLAIAGGVNVTIHPSKYQVLSEGKFASSDGRCRSFGEGGDGYVPGEGVGALLLKPLPAAVADGDHIYGIIRATAVNHGGKTNGYTVPNPDAQAELVATAIRRAGIDPRTISYLEAHGTGTALGDPIEVAGLAKAFALGTTDKQFCAMGSVKSNIGHLESAAGIAAVSKVLLQMKHAALVPTLHAQRPNPHLDLTSTPFYLQQEYAEWRRPVLHVDGRETSQPRRAGVSSFGAGGANAHVILEEYVPEAGQAGAGVGSSCLVVLSAKSPEQLHTMAANLGAYLAGPGAALSLADVSYTLHTGRQEMEHRFATAIADRAELIERLEGFVAGRPDQAVFTGRASRGADLIGDGPEAVAFLEALWANNVFPQMAKLWVQGVAVPWRRLWAGSPGKRVPLPTYPFARKKYWMAIDEHDRARVEQQLHPLLDAVVPTLEGAVFRKRFNGREVFVRDHLVNSRATLPGVACLEMARVAGGLLGLGAVLSIGDVVWLRPIYVEESGIDVRLSIARVGSGLSYQITSAAGLHCRGAIAVERDQPSHESAPLDLQAIQARCPNQIGRPELYALFAERGLSYGDAMQGVVDICSNDHEALGRLEVPRGAGHGYHPAALDAALHTIAGLLAATAPSTSLQVPASLESFVIGETDRVVAYAYAVAADSPHPRTGARSFHIDLADAAGHVVARFRHLRTAPIRSEGVRPEVGSARTSPPPTCFRARWMPAAARPADIVRQGAVAIVGPGLALGLDESLAQLHRNQTVFRIELGDAYGQPSERRWVIDRTRKEQYESVIDRLPDLRTVYVLGDPEECDSAAGLADAGASHATEALCLLRVIQSLRRSPACDTVSDLVLLTWHAQQLSPDDRLRPIQAALVGLAKSAAVEMPGLHIVCLDVDEPLTDANAAAALRAGVSRDGSALELAIRAGRAYQKEIVELRLPDPDADRVPLREGGVYLIVGGARGIGLEVARHLARTKHARLALVGRSALDEERRALLAELRSLGGDARYWCADVTDLAAMRRVVHETTSQWGQIAGVIHSALVLRDRSIDGMEEEDFLAAFDPKVRGSVVLHEATKEIPLDFLLFFSSGNTFTGAAGQSNYVAGCAFEDAFALSLRHAYGRPAHIVNWGFWGHVGSVATEEHRARMARQGIGSITSEQGIDAVERILAHDIDQAFVISVQPSVLHRLGVVTAHVARAARFRSPRVHRGLQQETDALVAAQPAPALFPEELHARLVDLARIGAIRTLQAMGVNVRAGGSEDLRDLRARVGIMPRHTRLFGAFLRSLERGGLVELRDERVTFTPGSDAAATAAALDDGIGRVRALTVQHQEFSAHAALLTRCVEHLPDVLQGRTQATDVLFPESSLEWVERIYAGNPVAQRFNRILAESVRMAVIAMLNLAGPKPVRILEVGAGTGGTSAGVLATLQPLAAAVTYVYTDLSPRFVQHGRRVYERDHRFCECRRLDIEGDVEAQGFESGSFDIVLAANVLHATTNVTRTLNEVKKLLKTSGLLILGESTVVDDFMTFTFGLLDGWWLTEDEDLRLADSPLLDADGWRRALGRSGFRSVSALEAARGAAVFIAESDGVATYAEGDAVPAGSASPVAAVEIAATAKAGADQGATVATMDTRSVGTFVEERLNQQVTAAFGLDPGDLDRDKRFSEFGADSIVSVELVNLVNDALHLKLKPPVLFDYSSIAELTTYITRTFGAEVAAEFGLEGGVRATALETPGPGMPDERGQSGKAQEKNGRPQESLEDVLVRLGSGAISYEDALRIVPDDRLPAARPHAGDL